MVVSAAVRGLGSEGAGDSRLSSAFPLTKALNFSGFFYFYFYLFSLYFIYLDNNKGGISETSLHLMEDRKEKNAPWLSVPQFGDWDQKGQVPDYSLDFSKIREMRKQNKRDVSRASLGNEEELVASNTANVGAVHNEPHYHQTSHSPTTRRSIFSYFNCCVKA